MEVSQRTVNNQLIAMKTFLFIGILVTCLRLDALADNPAWNHGHATLRSGQVLRGQLSYNWKAEILQVRAADGTTKAFSAQRIDSFTYFDSEQNALRKFSSVELATSSEQFRPVMLEECTVGRYTVYRRLRHSKELLKITRPSLYSSDVELMKDYDNFVYFVVDEAGGVTDLQQFEQTVWPQMLSEYRPQLTECLRVRQLDLSSTVARLILINQYNYLHEQNPTQANKPALSIAGY